MIETLLGMLELGTAKASCFPTRDSAACFMFRWSIIALREERSRFLLLLTLFTTLLLFEEEEPDLFLLGGFVFLRAILSQR
jgi:hypothetical protein